MVILRLFKKWYWCNNDNNLLNVKRNHLKINFNFNAKLIPNAIISYYNLM